MLLKRNVGKIVKGAPLLLILFFLSAGGSFARGEAPAPDETRIRRFEQAREAVDKAAGLFQQGFLTRHREEARKWLNKCLGIVPEFAEAHYYLARLSYEERDHAAASAHIQRAKENFKPMAAFLMTSAAAWARVKGGEVRFPAAYLAYGNKNLGTYYALHGDIFLAREKYTAARAQYIAALRLNPNLSGAYNQLARLYANERNFRKAFYYSNLAEMNGVTMESKLKKKILKGFGRMERGGKIGPRKKIGVYVKLRGGAGFADGGDFERFIDASTRYYNDMIGRYNWTDVTLTESPFYKELGAEIGYTFKRFAVGLEVGSVSKNVRVENAVYQYHFRQTGLWENTLSARSILLNVYYKLLKSSPSAPPALNAYLTGGGGMYYGRLKEFYDQQETERFHYIKDFSNESTGNSLGFHVGAGIDWNISRSLSVSVEGRYRFVAFDGMRGTGEYGSSIPKYEYEGDLLYVTDEAYGRSWFNLGSTGEIRVSEREAELNLKGFSLYLGIQYNF